MKFISFSGLPLCLLFAAMAVARSPKGNANKVPTPPVHGVKTPGVVIPYANLKSETVLQSSGGAVAGMHATGEQILLGGANGLLRFDTKTNEAIEPGVDAAPGVKPVCGGVLNAFGALWVPTCGDGKAQLAKIEIAQPARSRGGASASAAGSKPEQAKAGEMAKPAEAPPKAKPPALKPPVFLALDAAPTAEVALAASADSIWLLADGKTSFQRIDPKQMRIVAETRLPTGCTSILFAETSLWVACPGQPKLLRIDARSGQVEKRIDVPDEPVALAAGEGSIWVLSRKEGKVTRVDPKTNKSTATIDLAIPNARGGLAFGEGALWASAPGFPLMRIAPATDKLMQQFHGEGGGVVYFGAGSVWVGAPGSGALARLDPKRVTATLAE